MAWTQADLDALEASIKGGVRTVSYADRSVTYHSLNEMLKLRMVMQESVSAATAPTPRIGRLYISGEGK